MPIVTLSLAKARPVEGDEGEAGGDEQTGDAAHETLQGVWE